MKNKSEKVTDNEPSLLPLLCQRHGPGPGQLNREAFWILVELGRLRNPRVLSALEAHLVHGREREWVCSMYGVSVSYFAQRLKVIHRVWMLTEVLRAVSHADEKQQEKQETGKSCE